MTDDKLAGTELKSFEDALRDLETRATEYLTEGIDRTLEELDAVIDDYDMPDPLEDRPVGDEYPL